MSVPDLGIIADGNANEETRSNQSGDTLILSDGENENSGGYANAVRRRRSRREFVPDPQAENFLGRSRVVTGLERAHFGVDNITPGRPCTAYFTAGYFIDSKSVFDKLQEVGIPREAVVCMQRRPGHDMLVTFINEEIKNKFVSSVAFRYRSQSSAINAVDSPLTYLNIYDAPHELSDEALTLRLEKYCSVSSTRRGMFSNTHVYNGIRHYRVRVKEPIPSYLRFGKFLVRLSHDGQQHTCRRCNRGGHFANECQDVVCFNCDELGHEASDCEEDPRCCICKSTEHLARTCPYSWFGQPLFSEASGFSHRHAHVHVEENSVDNDAENVVVNVVAVADENSAVPDPMSSDVPVVDDVPPDDVSSQALISDPSPGEPSDPSLLDSQGFLEVRVVDRLQEGVSVPNPPGPQSSPSVDIDMESQQTSVVQPSASSSPPVVLPDDLRASSGVSSSSGSRASNQALVASSRRKPAPLPPVLEALNRRPTRPSLPVTKASGATRSGSQNPPHPPPDVEVVSEDEDMESQSSLKRKQDQPRKKSDPKKGKH